VHLFPLTSPRICTSALKRKAQLVQGKHKRGCNQAAARALKPARPIPI